MTLYNVNRGNRKQHMHRHQNAVSIASILNWNKRFDCKQVAGMVWIMYTCLVENLCEIDHIVRTSYRSANFVSNSSFYLSIWMCILYRKWLSIFCKEINIRQMFRSQKRNIELLMLISSETKRFPTKCDQSKSVCVSVYICEWSYDHTLK